MNKQFALTTFDNPFNPFENFEEWFRYDCEKGYYSCSVLARMTNFREDFTQKEIDEENERAINEIIKNDFLNIFTRVEKEVNDVEESS